MCVISAWFETLIQLIIANLSLLADLMSWIDFSWFLWRELILLGSLVCTRLLHALNTTRFIALRIISLIKLIIPKLGLLTYLVLIKSRTRIDVILKSLLILLRIIVILILLLRGGLRILICIAIVKRLIRYLLLVRLILVRLIHFLAELLRIARI